MSPLEILSNIFNLLSVLFAAKNSVLTWSTGIIGGVLFGILFYEQKLYADVCLQLFFIATSAIGWHAWLHGGSKHEELPISTLPGTRLALLCLAASGAALVCAYCFMTWTDASYPIIDSHILCFSILAQFLLMRRKVENWLCWIVVNSLAVPLYFVKGLLLTSGIYAVFLLNALLGLGLWKKNEGSSASTI